MMLPVLDLGELEREIMHILWDEGGLTADDVRERLPRKPKESTVRTVLGRLEKKGLLDHRVEGRTFVFHTVQERPAVAAGAVKRIVDWMCRGSVDDMLVGMADARLIDRETLERLTRLIDAQDKSA